MAWRDMTEQELATRPEARLGGALLWVVLAAAVVCCRGHRRRAPRLRPSPPDRRPVHDRRRLRRHLVRHFRDHDPAAPAATPVVASAGFIAWIAYRLAVALWSQAGWPLAVDLWAEAVLAAGFCGYMADGVRPNAYYRRRLPAA
jgi:hypothetical protein